jgi:simple sugar transport system permease protein
MITQMFVQGSGIHLNIPSQFLSSLPFAATIIVLVFISHNKATIRLNSPASLGQPFSPEA